MMYLKKETLFKKGTLFKRQTLSTEIEYYQEYGIKYEKH